MYVLWGGGGGGGGGVPCLAEQKLGSLWKRSRLLRFLQSCCRQANARSASELESLSLLTFSSSRRFWKQTEKMRKPEAEDEQKLVASMLGTT